MSQSIIEPLFKPPQSPTQFSAIGYLFGKFETVLPADEHLSKLKGSLQLFDGTKLEARVGLTVWQKLSQNPTFNLDNAYLWRVYFRTTKEAKLCQVQLIKCVSLVEDYSFNDLSPQETGLDQFQIRGRVLFTDDHKVVMRLERNEIPPPGQEKQSRWQPFLITVCGSLSGAEIGQFWELFCTRKGEELILKKANWVDESITVSEATPAKVKTPATSKSKKSLSKSSEDSSFSPIIMINGKQPEMTVKFTTRPDLPEQGKTVTLEVSGEEADLGKGYGTQMMHLAIEKCFAEPSVTAILVDTLASNRKELHRFYERLGFKFVQFRRFGLDECRVYRLHRTDWHPDNKNLLI